MHIHGSKEVINKFLHESRSTGFNSLDKRISLQSRNIVKNIHYVVESKDGEEFSVDLRMDEILAEKGYKRGFSR